MGEDELGELRFRVSPQGCWIEFTIDDQNNLWIATVGDSYRIDTGVGETVNRVRLEPGARIELPNNHLHISASMQRTTSSGVLITLTSVAPTDIETVIDVDYRQDPLFGGQPRVNELIEIPELCSELAAEPTVEWPAETAPIQATMFDRVDRRSSENDQPLRRYKWFLLGPLAAVSLFIAMSTGIDPESISKTSPIIPASTRVASESSIPIPERPQHSDLLDTVDRVLVNAEPDDGTVLDFATESFEAVLLSDPLNVRAQDGLANVQEQRNSTSNDDVESTQQATPIDEPAADEVEPTQPASLIGRPASSATARRTLLQAEQLLSSGDIIAPRGNNAVALIRQVLGEEPDNSLAKQLLAQCAERLITMARQAQAMSMNYEARNLLEEVLFFYPNHPAASELWDEWVDS